MARTLCAVVNYPRLLDSCEAAGKCIFILQCRIRGITDVEEAVETTISIDSANVTNFKAVHLSRWR